MLFFLFAIIFIAFYIVNASNDPQLRYIDKILVNKNRNYEILYGRDHVIYINTNILDEAVWVKQALEKNQPGKPVRVINPDDESIRIFSCVLRDYLSAIPLEINEKARYKPGIANYHNIITCGFSTLLPYIRQQPLAMQQRFNLLFPDFVDHIQLPLPLASTLLERITFYAKKNRDELDKLSCKWCCDQKNNF